MKASLFIFVMLLSLIATAQEDSKTVGSQLPKTKITVGAGISLASSYKRGNADQFYKYLSGNPALELDDGASGFKFLSLGFQSAVEGKTMLGLEFQYVLTHPTRAIWGEDTDYGFATRMYFSAKFLNIALKLGAPIGKTSYFVFEPGMDLGFMNGKTGVYNSLANYTQEWLESGAVGIGGHFAAGLDLSLGKSFIITTRAGYRYIKIDESHKDKSSSTGYSSFYANGKNGDIVKVDWSGFYANAGILLVLGK